MAPNPGRPGEIHMYVSVSLDIYTRQSDRRFFTGFSGMKAEGKMPHIEQLIPLHIAA